MQSTTQKHLKHIHLELLLMLFVLLFHLIFAFILQSHANIGGDGIFTYTLANNPYSFEYIDPVYDDLPQSNGWINASILKENYIVENYDRFNYSSVYWHQRIDNHPLLYYSLVHTVCSFFPGTYSRWFTMSINLFFLCCIDILFLKLFKKIYGHVSYCAVPFVFLFLQLVMQQLYTLPRMYLMLAFFCFWYLYIHWELITNNHWKKSSLIQMICCIFLGSQTHYYFYVYAGSLTILTLAYLVHKHYNYKLCNYIYSGILGIAASWILFPWIIWHIFFNQMQKHIAINSWSVTKLKNYVSFLNEQLFNGRGMIAVGGIIVLLLIMRFSKSENTTATDHRIFQKLAFGSGILFSLIIYTLDESVWYYSTPLYLTFIMWFSMVLIDAFRKIIIHKKTDMITISLSVITAVIILSLSSTINFAKDHIAEDRKSTEFSSIASSYKQYDCIFIEERQDNLLQGYFFEFGDYDEFKKISVADFYQNGINEDVLAGRSTENDFIVYAPVECILSESEYQFLESNGDYNIYQKTEG